VNVLFINQFFHPDLAATAQLLTDLTEDLKASGVAVTVVTGRAAYSDGRSLGPPVEVYRGIRIYRVGEIPLQRKTIWARYLSYLIFWTAATARCLFLPRHDVVVPLTTPPLLSCLGIVLRWVKGSRVVCWSMDVYPELGVLLGAIKQGCVATRVLGALSSWSLRRADRVVPLGSHMARHLVAKGVPADRIRILPTWEDPKLIVPIPGESNPFRVAHELDGRFVVLYSGNLGVAHEFGTLLDAASHLAADPGILFLFAGGGPLKRWVEDQVRSRSLQNVRFLPYQPREDLRFSLSAGDVHLVTLRPGFEGLLVPSKFVGALAAGRPILFVGPKAGEIPDALTAGDCGVVVEPGDWMALANAILALRADQDLLTRMGRNARALFERHYTRGRGTACFRAVLDELGI
jgi:colanic acid biosynthesis glycosyl transferase WcaI